MRGSRDELETGSFEAVDPETGEFRALDPETGGFEAVVLLDETWELL